MLATLLKSESEILYDDPNGKKTDYLADVDGYTVGTLVEHLQIRYRSSTVGQGMPREFVGLLFEPGRGRDDVRLRIGAGFFVRGLRLRAGFTSSSVSLLASPRSSLKVYLPGVT